MSSEIGRDPNIELLNAMLLQIERFVIGKKRYPVLLNELDAGICGLRDSCSDIRIRLREEWRTPEEVNALGLVLRIDSSAGRAR